MKKLSLALSLVGVIAAVGMVQQANAFDGVGTAVGTIRVPISFVETQTLNFGEITADGATVNATAIVNPDGTAGAVVGGTTDGNTAEGLFDVTGIPDSTYSISAVPGALNTCVNGACPAIAPPTVDNFVFLSVNPGAAPGAGLTDNTGLDTFAVGATLNFNATSHDGEYSGTYDLTIVHP